MKEQATKEKWEEIGAKSRFIYNELVHLIVEIDPYINKNCGASKSLHKAINYFIEFKSEAEEEMFRRGEKPGNPLDVFYGTPQYKLFFKNDEKKLILVNEKDGG